MFSIGLLKNNLFPLDQILNYMFSRGILVRFVFDWQILKHIFPIKLEKTVPQKICFHSVNTKQYVFDWTIAKDIIFWFGPEKWSKRYNGFSWQIMNNMFRIEAQNYISSWQIVNIMFSIRWKKGLFIWSIRERDVSS